MPYTDLYFSRKVSNSLGFARKLWMLKLPRLINEPEEFNFLGSIVEEIDIFLGVSYPLPFPMTTPAIMLKRLAAERETLNIPPEQSLFLSQSVVGGNISMQAAKNLDVGIEATLPGIPGGIDIGVSNEKLAKVTLTLSEGAEIQLIPTDYLARFAKRYDGDDDQAFDIGINVSDHLFVNMILLAKNYAVSYQYKESLSAQAQAEIPLTNNQLGPKLQLQSVNEYAVEAKIEQDVPYLLGFKTIDWDDFD
ncbi:MAG: hypothetical protein AAGG02_10560 [Cyanobacteria bacterium P01_H01_bin.15]